MVVLSKDREVAWFTHNWMPFYAEETNAVKLDNSLRSFFVVDGDEVIARAAIARAGIQALRLPDVGEELDRIMRREIVMKMDVEGDLLGHRLLQGVVVNVFEGRKWIDASAFCNEITSVLQGLFAAQDVRASLSDWDRGCLTVMHTFLEDVARKAEPVTWLAFRRGEANRTVYRAIGAMRNHAEALLPAFGPIFARSHGEVTRSWETYIVQPVGQHGRQGNTFQLKVNTQQKTPDLEVLTRQESSLWMHRFYDEVTPAASLALRLSLLSGVIAAEVSLPVYRYPLKTTREDGFSFRGAITVEPYRLMLAALGADPNVLRLLNLFQLTGGPGYDSHRNTLFLQYGVDVGTRDPDFGVSIGIFNRNLLHFAGVESRSSESGTRVTLRWTLL
jgi:hypothetical protein